MQQHNAKQNPLPSGMGSIKKLRHYSWKTFVVIVGIVPYFGMTFLTVYLWDKYIGLPELPTFTWRSFVYPPSCLLAFSILGSWCFWYLFCKLIKYW